MLRKVFVLAMGLALAGVVAAPSSAAPPEGGDSPSGPTSPNTASSSSSPNCEPLPVSLINYIDTAGNYYASPPVGITYATDYHSTGLDGWGDGEQIIPPVGWSPATASAANMLAWGFLPQPDAGNTDPDALTQWHELYDGFAGVDAPGGLQVCTDASATIDTNGEAWTSGIWSGAVPTKTTDYFKSLSSTITTLPTLANPAGTCANSDDAVAAWVGLGGVGTDVPLLQTGVKYFERDASAWSSPEFPVNAAA